MSKIKYYISLFAGVLLFISCNSCSHIPITEQYELNKLTSIDSVVKVESVYVIEHFSGISSVTYKMMSSSTGTSILNSNSGKYVLTTGHTCNPRFGIPDGLERVKVTQSTFLIDSKGNRHETTTIEFNEKLDVCILHSKTLKMPNMPIGWDAPPKVGDKVYNYAAPVGVFAEGAVPILEGRYSGKVWGMALYTIPAIGGSSGSPIFNVNGKMVGMIHSVHSNFHHLSFSPHHHELLKFIRKNATRNVAEGIELIWTDVPKKIQQKTYLDSGEVNQYIEKMNNKNCECEGIGCLALCL